MRSTYSSKTPHTLSDIEELLDFRPISPQPSSGYPAESSTPAYESLTGWTSESQEDVSSEDITPVEPSPQPFTDSAATRIESEFLRKSKRLKGKM